MFADPDRSSPEHILPLWPGIPEVKALQERAQDLPSHDRIFAEAIGRSRVVTGFVLTHKGSRVAMFTWKRTARIFRAHYRRIADRPLTEQDRALLAAPPPV